MLPSFHAEGELAWRPNVFLVYHIREFACRRCSSVSVMGHVCSKLPSAMGCGCSLRLSGGEDKIMPIEVGCNINAFDTRPSDPHCNTYKAQAYFLRSL